MRFMMLIKANKEFEAGIPPPRKLIEAMGRLAEELSKTGVLLSSEGMRPSSTGTRVRYSGGRRSLIDGPFTETKELIGGFAIVQAASKEEAIGLAERVVTIHAECGVTEFEMEVRPLFDPGECAEQAA
ncbi:MAG TPA: YciI family protein [Rhodanobacteraceae bacterium]|nr:YciI family protein [Rhodanobacteraceae bacterium]